MYAEYQKEQLPPATAAGITTHLSLKVETFQALIKFKLLNYVYINKNETSV